MTRTLGYVAGGPDLPTYARILRLRHLRPTSTQCFFLFEAMLVIGTLLALAELVPWWGVFVLPLAVAAMVKINDLVAGTAWSARRAAAAPVDRPWRRGAMARYDRQDPRATGLPGLTRHTGPPGGAAAHDRPTIARRTPQRWAPEHPVPEHGTPAHGPPEHRAPQGRAVGRAPVPPELRITPREGYPGGPAPGGGGTTAARRVAAASPGPVPPHQASRHAVPPDETTTLGLASTANVPSITEPVDSPRQRARQSATRRYG